MNKVYPRNVPTLATEQQAQSLKICHLTLASGDPRRCIGSSCSAWNWEIWPQGTGPAPKEPVGRCGLTTGGVFLPPSDTGDISPSVGSDLFDFSDAKPLHVRGRVDQKK